MLNSPHLFLVKRLIIEKMRQAIQVTIAKFSHQDPSELVMMARVVRVSIWRSDGSLSVVPSKTKRSSVAARGANF